MRFFCFIFLVLFVPFIGQGQEDISESVRSTMERLRKKESRYWQEKDWENHMRICHEFLVNYETFLTPSEKAVWNIKIAGTFIELKSYLLAVEYLEKGIPYADTKLKSFGYSQLGRSYIDLGKYDLAIKNYQSAIAIEQNLEKKVAHINSMGFVYFRAGLYEESREAYDRALQVFSTSSKIDSIQYDIIQSNIASLEIVEGKEELALERLYALEKNFRSTDSWFHPEVYSKMVPILLKLNRCGEVERVLNRLFISLGDAPISEDRLNYLKFRMQQSTVCGAVVNLAKVQEEYFKVNKALKSQELDRLIIIEKLQRDELKKRLKLVSDNLSLKRESEKQYLRLVIVSVSLLVLVILGAIFWWRSVRAKQRRKEKYLELREELMRESEKSAVLQREMEAKQLENKKLELKQTLQSMNNNATLLDEIQGRLVAMRDQEGDIQNAINDLIHFLKSHAGSQAINDMIEQNVETIGGDFRDRFFEKYNDLTASEVQLVLLLRIGLSTKEVALMRSVEPSSVRIFKHRLKSKLGLEKDQDLLSYIQNF